MTECIGWTRDEYLASPAMARRLHTRILDLEDEIAQLHREKHSYVCEQCGERYSDSDYTKIRDYEKALREAQWELSTLRTERDAAILAAQLPLRQALAGIAIGPPPDLKNKVAYDQWLIAKKAMDALDPDWQEAF